jgi:excisionase family DNA binding protein
MTFHCPEAIAHTSLQVADAKEAAEYVLGPDEVARILDLSPHDVRGLACQGRLRARRMGTRWRFRRDDVLAYRARLSQNDKSI